MVDPASSPLSVVGDGDAVEVLDGVGVREGDGVCDGDGDISGREGRICETVTAT